MGSHGSSREDSASMVLEVIPRFLVLYLIVRRQLGGGEISYELYPFNVARAQWEQRPVVSIEQREASNICALKF